MRILLGVTGGIAAFKASSIIRLLTEAGHDVKVVPTQNALRFIGSASLEALSHNSVDADLYTDVDSVKHVRLGQEADLVIVAPATAAFLARFANGLADDLLLNTLLVAKAPILVAPAMHTEMWLNEATVRNVETLRARGVFVLEPDSGRLTGTDSGPGRLPEPEAIVESALALVEPKDLFGVRLLVTAGGTREPIDPVRYIGNLSSGKQGVAVATEAARRGAEVTLIAANLEQKLAAGLSEVIHVQSTAEMQTAVMLRIDKVDALVMTAAVSDFRVENQSEQKIKRANTDGELILRLIPNADILQTAVAEIKENQLKVVSVGFAAETASDESKLIALAESKLQTKGCDIIVANDVTGGAVFGEDSNRVHIISKNGSPVSVAGTKTVVANRLLDLLLTQMH
ncbi:bifunctional phosphopantothenoylcysteine decarboxylase/phosphopantothenate--cysteine ligase CoaBC [Candidatus Rhodoluna planktonica]|uniref:Coenzyme A biosynthesis bifunctional protein CoaBC n=1 Tax=Candidatus Rhodoluna planktonica TaxID=535712 RepID=A0A1D9DZ25_9MICO|nr:bifunctional phosphopantothenoylcysteine decarboxylase/phosphopantothenate--cysteine ligase CoaBC [Candidatus Rhodoluna planktonica]AOY56063.1 phosphopantothenoylcysteine decarboxylase [Candidatus Rhodoluna planktonica]